MYTFLIPVVVFLGFFVGVLLARVSPEEMAPGKGYFAWLVRAVVLMVVASLVYFAGFGILGLLLGLVFGFFVREYYFALGMAVAMSFIVSEEAFFLVGALGFLFGIVYGTLSYATGRFTFINVFTKVVFFFLPFLMLLVEVPPEPFLRFAAGALVAVLAVKSLPGLHYGS